MHISFYWKTLDIPAKDYTISAQLFDPQGNKIGQHDLRPLDGAFPTNLWRRDDILHTDHSFAFDTGCLKQPCYLLIGFYELQTGQRLPVTQGQSFGDAVKIDGFFSQLAQ